MKLIYQKSEILHNLGSAIKFNDLGYILMDAVMEEREKEKVKDQAIQKKGAIFLDLMHFPINSKYFYIFNINCNMFKIFCL